MTQAERRHDRLAVRLSLIICRLVTGETLSVTKLAAEGFVLRVTAGLHGATPCKGVGHQVTPTFQRVPPGRIAR